jgi:CRP-like cAMP-binding protein
MMKTLGQDVLSRISKLPLFQELDADQLTSIAANAREIQISKGEMLFQKGDEAKGFYLVLMGQIKLAFPSIQGNEKVVAVVGSGQTFGEAAMFLDQHFPVRAEALVNSDVLFFGSQMIFALLAQDPLFARKLLAGLSFRLHQFVQDVELYSQRSSAQRVIGYLLQLCPSQGGCDLSLTVDLPTTKQVVASRLNLTPETLSRILHDLTNEGLIEMQGRRIHIPHPEPLRLYDI